jgi:hypothetical protein
VKELFEMGYFQMLIRVEGYPKYGSKYLAGQLNKRWFEACLG